MQAEDIQLFAISLTDQLLTAVEENNQGDDSATPLVLYLVAAKLRAAADGDHDGR